MGWPSAPPRPRCSGRGSDALAFAWVPALGVLWAAGWAITTAFGVDVESQYTVFGSSGALFVTAATVVLPVLLARHADRTATRAS